MMMANLRRPNTSKDKDIVVGRFIKPDGRCKKHPKHRQSPGVCSLCLTDRLLHLSAASTSASNNNHDAASSCSSSPSSLSSYYSSTSASSSASPLHHHPFPLTADGKRTSLVSVFLLSSKHGLVKSRSMAVLPRREAEAEAEADDDHNKKKKKKKSAKKSGFWSKLLLRHSSKRMEEKEAKVVVRSSSLREAMIAT